VTLNIHQKEAGEVGAGAEDEAGGRNNQEVSNQKLIFENFQLLTLGCSTERCILATQWDEHKLESIRK